MSSEPDPSRRSGHDLVDRLEAWVGAGLIRSDQAAAIRAHEGVAPAGPVAGRPGRRAWLAEVVGYVGAAFAIGALALILDDLWQRLTIGGRLALAVVLTVLVLAAGAAVAPRTAAPLRRLGAILWTAAVAGSAWSTALFVDGVLGLPDRWLGPTTAGVALVVALALLAAGGYALVQLAALAATATLGVTLLVALAPLQPTPRTIGGLLVGLGLAWGLAGAGRWLGPVVVAETAGALVALLGTQLASFGDQRLPGLWAGLALAAVLTAASTATGRPHLLLVGAAGLFLTVPQLVFTLFADTLGAPVTLLAVGLLLILLAVGLVRVRRLGAADGAPHA
jgi:hypothetical protein